MSLSSNPLTRLQYEICSNSAVVDLLVSLAYIAAAEGALDAPLPVGMGLRVKCRSLATTDPDGLHEFDQLDLPNVRICSVYPARRLTFSPDAPCYQEPHRSITPGKVHPRSDRHIPTILFRLPN